MDRRTKQVFARISGLVILLILAFLANHFIPSEESETTSTALPTDVIEIHFIDVGQGDSILIETENASMLIDAGENNKGSIVTDYLKSQNINELNYVIGTHPHSDHIGGLDTVINSIPIKMIFMPSVAHTTKTFEDVLDSIEGKSMTVTRPVVSKEYPLGPASFTIIAPNSSSYDDLNDYSIVIKLTYGTTSFLFTGDASSMSEEEMLENGIDLSADVLKVAHHGSSYSSSSHFLDAVAPEYAVISVGADNEYGHPHVKTLESIKNRGIKLYRTDKQGTVVFTSNGKTISVNSENYVITKDDLSE